LLSVVNTGPSARKSYGSPRETSSSGVVHAHPHDALAIGALPEHTGSVRWQVPLAELDALAAGQTRKVRSVVREARYPALPPCLGERFEQCQRSPGAGPLGAKLERRGATGQDSVGKRQDAKPNRSCGVHVHDGMKSAKLDRGFTARCAPTSLLGLLAHAASTGGGGS